MKWYLHFDADGKLEREKWGEKGLWSGMKCCRSCCSADYKGLMTINDRDELAACYRSDGEPRVSAVMGVRINASKT